MSTLASGIYFGVPRFVGQLYEATRAPTVILLIGFIGVPVMLSIASVIALYGFHSRYPFDTFIGGVLAFKVEADPTAVNQFTPHVAKLWHSLTPQQKETGKTWFEGFMVFGFILAGSFFWWCYRFVRFIEERVRLQMQQRH